VKVTIRYFASVREKVGAGYEQLELPAGIATVSDLRAHLRGRGGAWAEALADGKLLRAAINQDMCPPTAAIKAGDEIAFFPPVTGG
jgi:molybdopterin synthase sulfur carrier subunit